MPQEPFEPNARMGLYSSRSRAIERSQKGSLTETLRTSRQVLGDESPDTVHAMDSLVYFFYLNQGRFAEAKPLAQEALQISKRLFGVDHPQTRVLHAESRGTA
jgi:hypothetical protein